MICLFIRCFHCFFQIIVVAPANCNVRVKDDKGHHDEDNSSDNEKLIPATPNKRKSKQTTDRCPKHNTQ